jgi:hypothetical protein
MRIGPTRQQQAQLRRPPPPPHQGRILWVSVPSREVVRLKLTVHDVEALLVDLQVLVVLQVVDGNHSASLLDVLSVLVGTSGALSLLVDLSNLQDVLQTVKGDLDDLVVHGVEQVTHGLDTALRDEVSDLVGLLETTRGGVGDGPASFLLGLEVGVLENVDQRRNDVAVIRRCSGLSKGTNLRIDDSLNLHGGAGSDVGDGPASLLSDTVLGRGEQAEQSGESAGRNDDLGLEVIASDDVTDGSQSGGLDGSRGVPRCQPGVYMARVDTYIRRSTSRRQTPLSMTAWILSLVPSDK